MLEHKCIKATGGRSPVSPFAHRKDKYSSKRHNGILLIVLPKFATSHLSVSPVTRGVLSVQQHSTTER